MTSSSLPTSPRLQHRLAALAGKPLNFDPAWLRVATPAPDWTPAPAPAPAPDWTVTDLCQPLPGEPAGMPVPDGSWQVARRLMSGYEFADPSIVRAYYDPGVPLEGRNMLLKLKAFGLAYLFVGVRVGEVYEETRELASRFAHVWGWNYRTLQGHVEMGQMDWEVWKWLEDGRVEFHVHAISRPAPIPNPLISVGFRLLRTRERQAFLESTKRRMRVFTELAVSRESPDEPIRDASARLTARPRGGHDTAHDTLADTLRDT